MNRRSLLSQLGGASVQAMRWGRLVLGVGVLFLAGIGTVEGAVGGETGKVEVKQIPSATPVEALADPSDLVPWPVKGYPEFAPGSVVNTSWLLDAPAGKHGFVQAQPNGQLAFEDKTPVRFWGATLCYGATFPEKPEEIVKLADALAASGYNLVRLHHNDNNGKVGFLQSKPASTYLLDPVQIDKMDRLAAELYKRGVYIYLDCCDDRLVLEDTGLENWQELKGNVGWKGMFPHPKIVEAWKRAVSELLKHKNPYTGRTWGEEPGVATVEIVNENGPFWDWNFKLDDAMLKWHDQQWNAYLLKKYGSREELDKHWTDALGTKGLYAEEDPAKGSVFSPRLGTFMEWDRPYRSKTRGAARVNDYYAFLAESVTQFYKEASAHIRSLGFKGVIVGSHELVGPINQYAEVEGTGTIAAHLYAKGLTAWNSRPTSQGMVMEGVDVKTNNWFSNLPRIKVRGVPGVNGEWTGGTLTERADVNAAVCAMTAFQGVTESCHFAYSQRWAGVKQPNYDFLYMTKPGAKAANFSWSSMHDEPWMAVNRICGAMFIRGDFSKSKAKAHLAFSREDRLEQNMHALGRSGGGGTIGGAAIFLAELHNVECAFFDDVYDGDADVVFTTGRSASGDYRKAKHALVIGDNPWSDHEHKKRDLGGPARLLHPGVKIENLTGPVTFTLEWPYATAKQLSFEQLEGAVELASVPAGAQAIGKSADGKYTLGWLDDRFLVLPNGRALQNKVNDLQWLYRMYLAAAKRWNIDTAGNLADDNVYYSDRRQLMVDWGYGVLGVDTPRTQGFSGFVGWRRENKTQNVSCTLDGAYGNVFVTSVDGKAIGESGRMLLVATGKMQNTEQELGKDEHGFLAYTNTGKAPSLVEAMRGQISLASAEAGNLVVYALDSEGRRMGKVETKVEGGRLSFALSPKWGTIWFEIAKADVAGPEAVAKTAWPLEEKPRMEGAVKPTMVGLAEFWDKANGKGVAVATTSGAGTQSAGVDKPIRFVAKDLASDKKCMFYGNVKTSVVKTADHGQVLQAQFGKVTKDWFGGIWGLMNVPTGIKADDCLGFGFTFKGDGTMPKEAVLTLRGADGVAYTSKGLKKLFENDAWQEVILSAEDFSLDGGFVKKHPEQAKTLPPRPDWQTLNRVEFVCTGPLMDQVSVGQFGSFFYVLKPGAEAEPQDEAAVRKGLSALVVPANGKVEIPWSGEVEIKADGVIDEAAWKGAVGFAMDEEKVPGWHFFGSHVVEGKLTHGEGANFWLLATPKGLALVTEIHKGQEGVFAERADWYGGDCVEIFTDVENKGGKPTKQLFLAYRRPNLDRAAASESGIEVGRVLLKDGYMLEAVIPWKVLGFGDVPTEEFGLEFQIDYAQRGQGRVLQMTYGTGTNEAWIKADHFLKVKVKR